MNPHQSKTADRDNNYRTADDRRGQAEWRVEKYEQNRWNSEHPGFNNISYFEHPEDFSGIGVIGRDGRVCGHEINSLS